MTCYKVYLQLSSVSYLRFQSSANTKVKEYTVIAYSIHGHISYILEANSNRPNGFSLIGREPNEILQYK